ncbi:hypothetical protein [Medusavirus stheno T3]|uniref:RNA ligase domain-containing protein n=1 Tax=Medusavirus stheno T3 TaxID=3069717 RepID=A0A7S8BEK1_9VIRU|nr:hypothetical protein QKU73_gp398 [Acanthamoeba castellanii medusavirus]QPB44377.1 hypothetical protein [Medusavirus stheno T3]
MHHPSIAHLSTKKPAGHWFSVAPDGTTNYKWFIEEKVDGSQLSFQKKEDDGQVEFRNREKVIPVAAHDRPCYANAIAAISRIAAELNPAYTYHGEAVCKRRHNVVQYLGTPLKFWICFGIYDGVRHLDRAELEHECRRLGLECVQVLYANQDPDAREPTAKAQELVQAIEAGHLQSCLGGSVLEGIVVKHNNAWFSKSACFRRVQLKHVTAQFKECHSSKQPPLLGYDQASLFAYLEQLGRNFAVQAVYQKALQHIRENPSLDAKAITNVHALRRHVEQDIRKERKRDISEALYEAFVGEILKHATAGIEKWLEEDVAVIDQ